MALTRVSGNLIASGVSLTFDAGNAAFPALTTTGDTNTGIFFPAADTIAASTGGTERYRVNSAGHFGLNVTPSAWSLGKAIELNNVGNAIWGTGDNNLNLTAGIYYNGGYKYSATNSLGAVAYELYNGKHIWLVNTPASHAAGDSATLTEAMTLTSTSRLGIGTTAPASTLDARGDANLGTNLYLGESAVFQEQRFTVVGSTSGSTSLTFSGWTGAAYTERFRLPSSGGIQSKTTISVGDATPSTNGAGITFPATQSASTDANTLDDYEEGTWTASATPLTSGSITLSAATGSYTKIGRQVTVTGQFNTSAVSSPTGRLRISGFPFTSGSGTQFESRAALTINGATSIIAIDSWIPSGASFVDIYPTGTTTDSYASNVDASTSFNLSGTYFTT